VLEQGWILWQGCKLESVRRLRVKSLKNISLPQPKFQKSDLISERSISVFLRYLKVLSHHLPSQLKQRCSILKKDLPGHERQLSKHNSDELLRNAVFGPEKDTQEHDPYYQ